MHKVRRKLYSLIRQLVRVMHIHSLYVIADFMNFPSYFLLEDAIGSAGVDFFSFEFCSIQELYVHGTVHLSNTSHINTNEMQLFLFIWFFITLHVSDAVCVHHQE